MLVCLLSPWGVERRARGTQNTGIVCKFPTLRCKFPRECLQFLRAEIRGNRIFENSPCFFFWGANFFAFFFLSVMYFFGGFVFLVSFFVLDLVGGAPWVHGWGWSVGPWGGGGPWAHGGGPWVHGGGAWVRGGGPKGFSMCIGSRVGVSHGHMGSRATRERWKRTWIRTSLWISLWISLVDFFPSWNLHKSQNPDSWFLGLFTCSETWFSNGYSQTKFTSIQNSHKKIHI